ncbi:MAG: beta-ketoacyl-[acyl-carrier-protein] synthase family protein [Nitrospinota bacterium]|nr:beta-ketoacyl-[acyl-carrier-protein] synthase family protein [Nitrospinota bacterium]
MKYEPVVISGMGVISATGGDLAESLSSLEKGQRNFLPKATLFPTSLDFPVFQASSLPDRYHLEGRRSISLALCAVDEALAEAGLANGLDGARVGVCLGTTVSSQLNDQKFYFTLRQEGAAPLEPVDRYVKMELSSYIKEKIGARGPALTVVNACSSGSDALGVALSWLRHGVCDIVVAGGADELSHIPLCGFVSLGIVSPSPCAPFDKNRKGLNLGEGAGVLVLESQSSAKKRGAPSRLRLLGYGSCADAYHLTAPRPDGAGLITAIHRAMMEAGISPEQIGFINAHGTATPDNDKVEGKVFQQLFGEKILTHSTKGYTGHTLGAAGGIEAVFAAAFLREGWMPGSAGFETYDEEVGLAPVGRKTVSDATHALSTSLAFGGNNAALIMGIE